ncbi:MAG TPA: FAD-dependent oxidoreductase [Bacteroidales bacterium]|jgi:heterodisulfide reductase subunit A|nr:FAD-dependent oxidoreductase [Bacteroidota bacterium]OQC59710.1 MAG: Glutamate synthase (NADPH) small chain [Bacteroidetes bacterium ADurb.Bin012]HNQ60207.1 FAD-dependent oxidoreductase [Bacteroidales bacterium]HNU21863.1 FAD-dependent oxidoreductase [Bacteroidales bacterium]HNV17418.1 FAD-dependent oxidoreductase [Bacteroidales bacterium]
MDKQESKYDALVVGGGIAGQEMALSLADMGYQVLLVEKGLSIGGKMIQLSKVFPTLDCAACITTPKMSETSHHPNIRLLLNSEVEEIKKNGTEFSIRMIQKPRFVIQENCTGCGECEAICPEIRNDDYNANLAGRKVAYIPFSLANPRIAAIDRQDHSAPCINECPGGVKAYGYITLARNGQYEEAMKLHLEDIPFPGSLGRACYAPCQNTCTRGKLEGPVDIRKIKRFFSDWYYEKYPEPLAVEIREKSGKRIAVIGSGPAGMTAAYHLALKGHTVKIFEAAPQPGGMLRLGLPEYRAPKHIVDRDLKNITVLGVEIEVNKEVADIKALKEQGFDAVFIAVGTHEAFTSKIEGSELKGVFDCLKFLREANIGKKDDLTGKKVMVIGGGNTAIDAARTSLRLGAEKVTIVYRRSREEMPCFAPEIQEAEEEGVEILILSNPVKYIGENGWLKQVQLIKMRLGEKDSSGRRSPDPIPGSEYIRDVDYVIEAIGMRPHTKPFAGQIELNKNGTIKVDEKTLQTSVEYVFAGGDTVMGATTLIEAAGQGKKAAFYMDKYLRGLNMCDFEYGDKLPAVDKSSILRRYKGSVKPPILGEMLSSNHRIKNWDEIEKGYTETELKASTDRCLDCGNCRECHQCISACPANAIDFSQKTQIVDITAKSVILTTGYKLFPPNGKPNYGYTKYANVIDSLQMDRLIAPTRPFNNVLRPGDGKIPDNIAYILCTGSRDSAIENSVCGDECSNNPICSQICCMYSIKQAQLLMGALPMADVTVYYMDIRAFGKGYEEFFQQTKSMGVNFIKGKVASIRENENGSGDLILRYEDVTRCIVKEAKHDLVVLSVGVIPNKDIQKIFTDQILQLDDFGFVKQVDELLNPASTNIEGVFVAGAASGPKDIPDSILSAGCAASEVAGYLATMESVNSVNQMKGNQLSISN